MRSCLICDDHALMRDALSAGVSARWPAAEVQQAADFETAWALAAAGPELCLVDLVMPGAGPVDGVVGVLEAAPEARVIVVTGSHDDAVLLELLGKGVHGFLQKTATSEIVRAAIELVLAGGRYLPPRVADLAIRRGVPEPVPSMAGTTTERQREVLLLIAQGHSNKEIARVLGVSPATVKTHVANAISSVGATNRTEAAIRARMMGLI